MVVRAQRESLAQVGAQTRSGGSPALFEKAIRVKHETGGWLTGVALGARDERFLFDTVEKCRLILEIAAAFGMGTKARIYLPGIGLSDAGIRLIALGCDDVIVGDIGESSLNHQETLFGEAGKAHVVRSNLLEDSVENGADIVVDSSVLDVFLARPGLPIAKAVDGMKRQMRTDAVFVCFSMNNQTIFRHLCPKFKHIWYSHIRMEAPQSIYKRNCTSNRADVSLWVCTDVRTPWSSSAPDTLDAVVRLYMAPFLYAPTLAQTRNEYLDPSRFCNNGNTSV